MDGIRSNRTNVCGGIWSPGITPHMDARDNAASKGLRHGLVGRYGDGSAVRELDAETDPSPLLSRSAEQPFLKKNWCVRGLRISIWQHDTESLASYLQQAFPSRFSRALLTSRYLARPPSLGLAPLRRAAYRRGLRGGFHFTFCIPPVYSTELPIQQAAGTRVSN